MTGNYYQKLALRTTNGMSQRELLVNCALGMSGETGEVILAMSSPGYNTEIVCEELGDCCWYMAVMADCIDVDLREIFPTGIHILPKEKALIQLAKISGIIADIVKKSIFHNHELNMEKMKAALKEYFATIYTLSIIYGLTFKRIFETNIEKLKVRYPDGFDPDRSINRETSKKIYTVKIRDKETGESQAFTFQKPESVESCIDIYSAIGKDIFVESRERLAGE